MVRDSLGNRMKGYEQASRTTLPLRMPVIVRVDGKAFHTWTRGLGRPFDDRFMRAMDHVAEHLCREMQGAALAYVQSDEISVLVHNYRTLDTAAWFDNQVQKIVSVSASVAGAVMTSLSSGMFSHTRLAFFDARVWVLPEAEVANYFLWRQQDATRNSIQAVAQSLYSQAELHGKTCAQQQELIFAKSGQNWNDLPVHKRRGRCIVRRMSEADGPESAWMVDLEPPEFGKDRSYIDRLLAVEPEPARSVPRFGEG